MTSDLLCPLECERDSSRYHEIASTHKPGRRSQKEIVDMIRITALREKSCGVRGIIVTRHFRGGGGTSSMSIHAVHEGRLPLRRARDSGICGYRCHDRSCQSRRPWIIFDNSTGALQHISGKMRCATSTKSHRSWRKAWKPFDISSHRQRLTEFLLPCFLCLSLFLLLLPSCEPCEMSWKWRAVLALSWCAPSCFYFCKLKKGSHQKLFKLRHQSCMADFLHHLIHWRHLHWDGGPAKRQQVLAPRRPEFQQSPNVCCETISQ